MVLVDVLYERIQDQHKCDLSSIKQTADKQVILTMCNKDQENHFIEDHLDYRATEDCESLAKGEK